MRVAIFILALVTLLSSHVSLAQDGNVTGIFSSFRLSEKSGDYVGAEIQIVHDPKGYSAIVQASEGAPGSLEVVAVSVRNGTIEFSIPTNSASGFEPGTYIGVVTIEGLRLQGPRGLYGNYLLPRKGSYWR
jgi:hypothetical protein